MNRTTELIDGKYSYYAFICYTHADYRVAAQLHKKLQRYGLPNRLRKETNKAKRLVPMFLDQEDMLPGSYETVDKKALMESKFLIVVCSHNLHSHDANVNKEIYDFLSFGNSIEQIIPYIIDSDKDPEKTCFPSALIQINNEYNENIIGPCIYTPSGKKDEKRAQLRVLAKMHNIKASRLEDEDTKRRKERTTLGFFLMILFLMLSVGFYSYIRFTRFPCKVAIEQRYEGAKTWYDTEINVTTGDTVEFLIEFDNTRGFLSQLLSQFAKNNNITIKSSDIMVRAILPNNLEYIDDSTVLYDASNPEGLHIIENTLITSGINIGNYTINSNAYIKFKCKAVEKIPLPSESVTWATVTIWPEDTSQASDEPIHVKDSISTLIDN